MMRTEGTKPEKRKLTREEILTKMNHIPAFAIINDEGHMVGLQDKETEAIAVSGSLSPRLRLRLRLPGCDDCLRCHCLVR